MEFMRKRALLFWCIMLLSVLLRGQEVAKMGQPEKEISIEECQQWAMDNYPAIRRYGMLERIRKYTLSNISRVYMPEFGLSGMASWQSERMELDLKMPDKMNVSMDLSEVEYANIYSPDNDSRE